MLLQAILLIFSLAVLYWGAEISLNSAEKIGIKFGLSPLVVGLLIVALGTSLPEFFVSQLAAYRGHSEIALGNIIGSNVANLFLIMGLAGLLVPLRFNRSTLKSQCILHLVLTLLLTGVLFLQKLYWYASLTLALFFVYYVYQAFKQMKKGREKVEIPQDMNIKWTTYLGLVIGFGLLYAGGELLVNSGSKLGKLMNVSEYVLSAVIVAFGTSFPELITSLIACLKKKDVDIITGNVIGSNIFNVAFVMSSIGIYEVPINQTFYGEIIVLIFASIYLLGLALLKKSFAKYSGILFLMIYFAMVIFWIK